MSNLPESENYDAGVYQIEQSDAVIGGVDGIANAAARNLANRTNWLKAKVDQLLQAVGDGLSIDLTGYWNNTNDGAVSGLDADLLDGHHASDFALAADITNSAFLVSKAVISENYTVPIGKNALLIGNVTIQRAIDVTVPRTSNLKII